MYLFHAIGITEVFGIELCDDQYLIGIKDCKRDISQKYEESDKEMLKSHLNLFCFFSFFCLI